MPITWRNVSLGGAASAGTGAMQAASNFFKGAQQGGKDIIKSAREQNILDNAALTQDYMKTAFADNDLSQEEIASAPEGVDIASLMDRSSKNKLDVASIARDVSSTRASDLQSTQMEWEQSPEQRAVVEADRKRKAGLEQANLEARQQTLKLAKDKYQRVLDSAEGRAGANQIWNDYKRGAATEVAEDDTRLMDKWNVAFPEGTEAERTTYKQTLDNTAQARIDVKTAGLFDKAERDILEKYTFLTPEDLDSTNLGRLKSDRAEIRVDAEKVFNELNAKRQFNLQKASEGEVFRMVGGPGNWTIASSDTIAQQNKMTKTSSLARVQGLDSDYRDEDKDNKGVAERIWENVGGGKVAFDSIFQDASTVSTGLWGGRSVDWEVAEELSVKLGEELGLKASSLHEAGLATRGNVPTFEDANAKLDKVIADREFKGEEQDTVEVEVAEIPDLKTIVESGYSDNPEIRKQGVEGYKKGRQQILDSFKDISTSTKNRYLPTTQKLERALTTMGFDVSGKNKVKKLFGSKRRSTVDTEDVFKAYADAQEALGFLRQQEIKQEEATATKAAEDRLLKSLMSK